MTAIDVLARGLFQTTVQGSVAVLIVWVICRAIPRLPASAKCALWWVASAKLLVSLATIEPIGVPVVPSGLLASTPAAMPSLLDPAESLRVYCGVGPCARDDAKGRIVTPTPTLTTRAAGPVSRAITTGEVLMLAVVAAWLLGVVAALSWLAARTRHARRIVAEARPASDQLRSMAERLATELGLRTIPDLRISNDVQSPQALGVFPTTVLLPAGRFDTLTPAEQQMALCHELVHVKRGDLWLAWLPALAERICFFNPLAHVAAREYLLAREAACDADVLRALDASPQAYGRLLLALGIGYPEGLAAAGASRSVTTLTRRLSMLAFAQSEPARIRRLAWTVVAVAACTLLPLRLAATAEQAEVVHSPSGSQTVQPAIVAATPSGASGSRAVLAPSAPIAATVAASPHIASGRQNHDAWVLLRNDDNITMSGDSDDVAHAKRQRKSGEPLLWIRHDGHEYVIRDAAVIKQAQQLFEPVARLGAQQAEIGQRQAEIGAEQAKIGAQQSEIGARQAAIGAQQGAIGAKQAELSARQLGAQEKANEQLHAEQEREHKSLDAEMQKLDEQMRALGKEMDALNAPMEELSKKMEPLSNQQEEYGHQMEKLSSDAENQMKHLVDDAIAKGTAEAVH
jgi:bla regulator protein blaR1